VRGGRLNNWGLISGRDKRYYLLHVVQTGSGAHPASYPMSTRVLPPGIKQTGRESDHFKFK
jgi:hypothetical protein